MIQLKRIQDEQIKTSYGGCHYFQQIIIYIISLSVTQRL